MNLIVMIIITIFVSLSQNQETPEIRYHNIFLFGNNNLIKLIYSHCPAKFAYSETIEPYKNGTKFMENLQQGQIQLMDNTTDQLVYDNDYQRPVSEIPNINRMIQNKNFLAQNIDKVVENSDGEQNLYDKVLIEQTTPAANDKIGRQEVLYEFNRDTNECGISSIPIKTLIDDGNIPSGIWPWWSPIYILTSDGSLEYKCGGTLITPNIVLTAANCFYSDRSFHKYYEIKDFRVGLGLTGKYYLNESNTFLAEINDIIVHPSYIGRATFDGDIAIIILRKSYFYSDRIRPACLWTEKANFSDVEKKEGYVASFIKESQLNLSIFETGIVPTDTCLQTKYAYSAEISADKNFCAEYVNGQGPCYGNTGQGLMIEENGKLYLRGVVVGIIQSKNIICDSREYGIYTDVVKFKQWIQKYIK